MSFEIIKRDSQPLSTIVNNEVNRRDFMKQSSAVVLMPLLASIPYRNANAIIPALVAGTVVRFFARRIVTRIAGKMAQTAGRKLLSSGARTSATQYGKKVAQVGLLAGFAPEILAAAAEAGTDIIWAKSGYYNDLNISVENKTEEHIDTQMEIILQDSETGEIEMSAPFVLSSKPLQREAIDIQIKDLPNKGVKRVVGVVENENIIIHPSDKIVIASDNQIYR